MTTKRNLAVIALAAMACWVLLFFVLAAPGCAYAQSTLDPAAASVDVLAGQAFDAVAIGDWWALASVAVFGLTLAIRSGAASQWAAAKWPRLSKFLLDPVVMFFVPIALAGVPGTLAAVVSGAPFTLGLLVKSIVAVSGGAKTIFLGWKNFEERQQLKAVPDPHATAPGGAP